MPRVSIILPAYNAAATLSRAIESLQAQTFADWELIAVDDGSSDNSLEVLRAFARTEPRLHVIACPHGGIVAALNAGIAASRGEIIARMDADDEAMPERLTEQLALLARDPELGLVASLVEFGGDRQRNAGYALHVDWLNSLVSAEDITLNRFVESPFAHPSVMFRRELIHTHGGYRAGDFPEDYELWLRWLDAGVRMAKVPRLLLRWNDPPLRLSRTDARYSPERFFTVKAGYLARHLERLSAGTNGSRRHRTVYVWGAGRPTRKRAEALVAHGVSIAGYIDIDPKKIGRAVGGRRVIGPDELPAPGEICVLGYVSTRGARELIRAALRQRGYREGNDFVMCA